MKNVWMNKSKMNISHIGGSILSNRLLFLAATWLILSTLLHSQETDAKKRQVVNANDSTAITLSIEIPRIKVSEYHCPYLSVWVEDDASQLVNHIAVWYQQDENEEGHGEKWLPDLRQWWRRGGRDLKMPVDGISGATRPVGKHDIQVPIEQLKHLKPGSHTLVVEASREVGGREVVKLPFTWPAQQPERIQQSGESELGEVIMRINPISKP